MTYADFKKKPVIKRNAEVIVIKNITCQSNISEKPFSLVIYRDPLYDGWIAEEICLYENYEDNYYYLFESIEKVNGKKYRIFPDFIRQMLSNCQDYAMGKKDEFRL